MNTTKLDGEDVSAKLVISNANHQPPELYVQSPDIDTGWAKVIVGAAIIACAISSGVYFTFSMYFPLLLNEFQASRATTAWVGSLNNGIYMLAGPISAMCIQRFGCRLTIMLGGILSMAGLALSSVAPNLLTLFFTYGGIAAVGLSLNYTAWIVAISDSFQKKHALAFSLSQSGAGIGIFVFGPLFSFLISEYGWRGAMLLTGGCAFHLTCLGALVFPPRPPVGHKRHEDHPSLKERVDETGETLKRIHQQETQGANVEIGDSKDTLSRFDFCAWMVHLSAFLWLLATAIPYILLADYTRSRDLEEYYIIMLSAMGVGDLIGRLSIGPLVSYWKVDVIKLYAVSQLTCAIFIMSFIVVVNGIQMIIQGLVFSITFGIQCVLLALVPRSIFGSENLNQILGVTMFFGGAGILVGPPIAGQLVDLTYDRSYWLAFVFSSVVQLLASVTTMACFYGNAKRRRQSKK